MSCLTQRSGRTPRPHVTHGTRLLASASSAPGSPARGTAWQLPPPRSDRPSPHQPCPPNAPSEKSRQQHRLPATTSGQQRSTSRSQTPNTLRLLQAEDQQGIGALVRRAEDACGWRGQEGQPASSQGSMGRAQRLCTGKSSGRPSKEAAETTLKRSERRWSQPASPPCPAPSLRAPTVPQHAAPPHQPLPPSLLTANFPLSLCRPRARCFRVPSSFITSAASKRQHSKKTPRR